MTTVGLDIGGTKILGAVVADDGTVLAQGRRDTPGDEATAIVAAAADLTAELTAAHAARAVGVACAGFVDHAAGRIMFAPNLPWRDEPLRDRLSSLVGLPVVIENDANAATWGEFVHGSAADVRHLMFLTIGTGVGGGVVSDGRLLRGSTGMAAELGHVVVDDGGRLCGCGVHGCLEQYASGTALLRAARDLVASGDPSAAALAQRCGGDPEALLGEHLAEVAATGDAAAVALYAEVGRWIGKGAASLVSVLDPEMVLIGGGVSRAGDLVMGPALESFAEHLPGRGFRPTPVFQRAALLDDAGVVGAAALAREVAEVTR